MIYLIPEVKSGLGEDTFWCWFEREFKNVQFLTHCHIPENFNYETDCIIVYSTKGNFNWGNAITFSLCWELYPEMSHILKSDAWDDKIYVTHQSAKSVTEIFVASNLAKEFYQNDGKITVMPIGVDTNLFKPISDDDTKNQLKIKYNVPLNQTIGIWCGTTHPMKGFDNLIKYANNNPDIFWIIIWKTHEESGRMPDHISNIQKTLIRQDELAILFGLADFFLSCGLLRPYFMVEYEAMACNLPLIFTDNIEKDFVPSNCSRNDIFAYGWDRDSVKQKWVDKLKEYGITI